MVCRQVVFITVYYFFCTYFLELLCLKLKKLMIYAVFIHVFLPLVSYLYVSEKIFNAFCAIFIFFAETEDALAKLIFLMPNKCLSCLNYCVLSVDSFSTCKKTL